MILFLIATWLGGRYATKQGVKDFKVFNGSDIRGIIENVETRHHGSSFQIKGDSMRYIFYPMGYRGANGDHPFTNFAQPGDSVIKKAYGDSIILIKDGKRYIYFFQVDFKR